jgi:CubicO group peptidase (beta-lactamase class C family)
VEAALRRYVFAPAGMGDTSFGGAQASGHVGPSPVRGPYPRAFAPAGGLVASVADLLSFAAFAIDDPTLPVTGAAVASSTGGGAYGLGWYLGRRSRVRWHFGDWGGFHSLLVLVPEHRVAVAVVGNDDHAVALRDTLAWGEISRLTGLRRPRLAPAVHTGRSLARLAAARTVAAVKRPANRRRRGA